MQRVIRHPVATRLMASLAVLLIFAVPSPTIWGEPPGAGTISLGDAKATGSLIVLIKPKAARQEGVRWQVDDGAWQRGGHTVSGLSVGQHTVTFNTIAGWDTPKQKKPSITADQTTTVTGRYVLSAISEIIMLPRNVPLELMWIPAGSFMMGRYADEQDSSGDESPQHQVTFANGFWMGKYEVTQAQWVAVMGSNPSYFTGDLSRPVEQVSWDDAQAFISAVNALGQGTVHLPTEAQWEYACRAGTMTRFYWGDDASYTQIGTYAWYYPNSSSTTHPVGLKTANVFGLFDMSGNVWEWCEDWYHSSYTRAPTDGSAWVWPTLRGRVVRGGSWNSYGIPCRSASRDYTYPSNTYIDVGFRLAR